MPKGPRLPQLLYSTFDFRTLSLRHGIPFCDPWELFDLWIDSFYLCDLAVSFQQLCYGVGVAALTLICL